MATKKTDTIESATMTPELVQPGFPSMPSADKVAAARASRKAAGTMSELKEGTVLGLPDGWVAAKLDPAIEEGRKAVLRAKWASKGWIKLEGTHQVVGYPLGAEVWVKTQADFEADRKERDERILQAVKDGTMLHGMG